VITLRGALGAETSLQGPARRIVSLVPSETESLFMLGEGARVVGRTDYCFEPAGAVEHLPSVGGTKDARVDDVVALAPDLVLMNQEENTEGIHRALVARGVTVHLCFPKTVGDALALTRDLATLCGLDADAHPVVADLARALAEAERARSSRAPVRVFCPIWMDPLMTVHGETFISDVLDLAGGANVFADRTRRYPLAADLGAATPWSAERVGTRDVRYPRVTLDEVVRLAPDVVILPDEPHPFSEADAEVFRALPIPAARSGRVHRIDGKDLSWYSPRLATGVARVARWLAA
jgi:ABC-type Fe3+-hydroxamate transport system substrate-binding protein